MVGNGARAATVFPVISGYHVEGARVEDLTIDGNKGENVHLTGCRGGGIFLSHGSVILTNCMVRGNSALSGGGIYSIASAMTLNDCTVNENAANNGGGSEAMRA